ncbi:CBS domain-containing protein [Candidatus Woesearchaeota archaeon]|nr:CBS domain-containing protein [Candidatus Woesearchaeota archaeon]
MKISEIMHEIKRMPPDVTAADVAMFMGVKETGSVLLEDKGEPLGLITERDILRKVTAKNRNPSKMRAIDIASYPLITVSPDISVEDALDIMGRNSIRRILVSDGLSIIGKVTAGAIAKNIRFLKASALTGK